MDESYYKDKLFSVVPDEHKDQFRDDFNQYIEAIKIGGEVYDVIYERVTNVVQDDKEFIDEIRNELKDEIIDNIRFM